MRVLLSTIGSRGDVQPLVALAVQLRDLGHKVRLCTPPDFREWIAALGFTVTPIGPEVRQFTAAPASASTPAAITPERRRQMIEGTVDTQFTTIAEAATGCDVIVAATALQIAARSVAERLCIPYVFAAYSPTVLPSPLHPPILLTMLGDKPAPDADSGELWAKDAQRWNDLWGSLLNARRTALGLAPVDDVRGHILTDRPWLAADPTLAPWPDPADATVFQPGAWILADQRLLAPDVERFLDRGDAPVYFGFGSARATPNLAQVMIEAARALGRRAIVSRGWAELSVDDAPDVLSIGEVNQQALFPRVAAVVHHGGAGTATGAALSGASQVVVPQIYDQHYFARRVAELGVGVAHAPGAPTSASLIDALTRALRPDVAERARTIAGMVRRDGAAIAARHVETVVGA